MVRRVAVIGCIGAAMLPAIAVGGPPADPEYGGKIDRKPNRYIGFDIRGSGDSRRLGQMFVVNVPFDRCDDPADDGKQGGTFDGEFAIDRDGSFAGTKSDEFRRRRGADGITYTLKGRVAHGEAEGTLKMRILGTNCRSGLVEWKARKPSPPVPET